MKIAKYFTRLATGIACCALGSLAFAQQTYFTSSIDQAQETPPTGSAATGSACVVLDVSAHTVTYNISFSGLGSAENAAHFHQGAPGVAGPVVIGLPLGSPKIGTAATTPAIEAAFLSGNIYINIHSNTFGGGEIRGQVLVGPATPTTLYCPGDGSGTACPCLNHSPTGNNEGCLSSLGIGGRLRTAGIPSFGCDTLRLVGDQMTNSNCLYFQGTAREAGGAGTATFDGLICVTGTIVRLGTGTNVGGASMYPASGQVAISIRGQNQPGLTRDYQVFYRNAANFCTPGTANYTNAAELTWVP